MVNLSGYEVKHYVDARLKGDYPSKAVAKMASLAISCVQYEDDFRPNMRIVVKALQPLLKTAPNPTSQTSNSKLERRRYVEQWMIHCRFPEELRRQVREAERLNWASTSMFNEETLMEKLPENLQRDIRHHLFRFIRHFYILGLLDQRIIEAICERLRTEVYVRGSTILYPGGCVDKIVFIIQGKMESTFVDAFTSSPLAEGDFCGETLFLWCIENSSVNTDGRGMKSAGAVVLSDSLVRCLTNVEALVLRAEDLEEVVSLFARFIETERIRWAARYMSPYWRRLAARRIQVSWRHRQKRLIHDAHSSTPPHH